MSYSYYYYKTKLSNLALWYFLLPLSIFIVVAPVALPALYKVESSIEASAMVVPQNQSEEAVVVVPEPLSVSHQQYLEAKTIDITTKDFRAIVLDAYFEQYNSPLMGMGHIFVEACDKYDLPEDCTTLAAIGKAETDLCNYGPSQQQKNCWGFGGSGPNRIVYDSYEYAIDQVSYRLSVGYGKRYVADARLMAPWYCGRHCDRWGGVVEEKRVHINQLAVQMGFPPLSSLAE